MNLDVLTGLTAGQRLLLFGRCRVLLNDVVRPGGRPPVIGLYRSIALVVCLMRKNVTFSCSREASTAKLHATDSAMRFTTNAVQVLGGAGSTRAYPAECLCARPRSCRSSKAPPRANASYQTLTGLNVPAWMKQPPADV